MLHSDAILGDMTGYFLVLKQVLYFYLYFVYLFLNKWSPAVLGGSVLVTDLGSSMLSSRFLFLGDRR